MSLHRDLPVRYHFEIEKVGNYGRPSLKSFCLPVMLLELLRDLLPDSSLTSSELLPVDPTSQPPEAYKWPFLDQASDLEGMYELYEGRVLWGRIKFP